MDKLIATLALALLSSGAMANPVMEDQCFKQVKPMITKGAKVVNVRTYTIRQGRGDYHVAIELKSNKGSNSLKCQFKRNSGEMTFDDYTEHLKSVSASAENKKLIAKQKAETKEKVNRFNSQL
jgi:hypothetical protein